MIISKSVGESCSNLSNDVRAVQILLNEWRTKYRRLRIKVDGIFGSETKGAIKDFQTTVTGVVDGHVDPGGGSIKRLYEFYMADPVSPTLPELARLKQRVNNLLLSQEDPFYASKMRINARFIICEANVTQLIIAQRGMSGTIVNSSTIISYDFMQNSLASSMIDMFGEISALPLNQGQADGSTMQEACVEAQRDCKQSTPCPAPKKFDHDHRCQCWKGGSKNFTCIATCSCKEADTPVA